MERSITDAFRQVGGELTRDPRLTQMVLCPIHPDSTPSMKLDVERNTARCFSCRRSWTPQQLMDAVAGREPEEKKGREAGLVLIDQFESQILDEIRKAGKRPIDFMKIFVMLDVAREDVSKVPYEKLYKLLDVVRGKMNAG